MGKRAKKIKGEISHKQRKLLRYAIKSLGLEEYYRDILLRCAGVDSSTGLDLHGFRAVMAYLEAQGFEYQRSQSAQPASPHAVYLEKWKQQAGERPGMATPGQLALVDALWDELSWWWNKAAKASGTRPCAGFYSDSAG